VRAPARHHREARQAPELPVVAHEDRASRDLARLRVGEEGGDEELAFGEGGERPQVDRPAPPTEERREDGEADRRYGDAECDHPAERERRPLQEPVA
jgi:hypothetical protein